MGGVQGDTALTRGDGQGQDCFPNKAESACTLLGDSQD